MSITGILNLPSTNFRQENIRCGGLIKNYHLPSYTLLMNLAFRAKFSNAASLTCNYRNSGGNLNKIQLKAVKNRTAACPYKIYTTFRSKTVQSARGIVRIRI